MNCPCGLPCRYADCCGRYHAGTPAPTAEALMRSRYVAYVLKNSAYLLATWHVSTRPATLDLAGDGTRWLGLEIKKVHCNLQENRVGAAANTVEFVARYKIGSRAHRLHETSRFVCTDGRWYYVDGDLHQKEK